MWSLLHFVTSTVQSKLPAQQQPSATSTAAQLQKEFVPILNLFSLLYPDREPLPPPDPTRLEAVLDTAMASIWVVYSSRAAADGVELPRPVPYILTAQIKWLMEQSESLPPASNLSTDHTVALLLSVYSNNTEVSSKLLNILIDAVAPSSSSGATPDLCMLPLRSLSTIAMHAKIRLMDKVKHQLVQVAEASKQLPSGHPPTITPALLETYSRLLIWLGTRNFQTHLIPAVFKSQAWPVLHALLEVIAYRVHLQLQYSYRFQLLQQLHTVVGVSIIPTQLFVCAENTTLRLIQGLSSPEFLLQLAKLYASDPKPLLSQESEELNRVFVCVLAKSMHISNLDTTNWLESFMRAVFTAAPQSWPEATSRFFPASLRQLCTALHTADYKVALVSKAEEEYRKFNVARGKANERELIQTYTDSESASLFLCVLWQQLLETGTLSSTCIKIVQRTQAKKLATYARKMADYIVFTCPSPSSAPQFNSVVAYLNELVWKYHIFPLDRLLLCMVMRGYDGRYATTALSLIHNMLLTNQDLQTRVASLVENVRPDHWNCQDWHSIHTEFLDSYPETFHPEQPGVPATTSSTMTMYFGNVCFRFLPVLCLYLNRLLEIPEMAALHLEQTLDKFGCLFAFHAHPANHLYTTLHYYLTSLLERPELKKKLVATVMGSQRRIRNLKWYFSPLFCEFLCAAEPVSGWTPPTKYYRSLLDKLVKGLEPFSLSAPSCDWQCSEFSGSLPLSLTCACVELLGLPLGGAQVACQLLKALYSMAEEKDTQEDVLPLINALALIFISLPDCYQSVLYESVLKVLETLGPERRVSPAPVKGTPSCLLSLMHSFWLHGNLGLLLALPQWLQLQVGGVVSNEGQLLYVLQLLGPILHRVMAEKPKLLLDIVMEIYRLLKVVDQRQKGLLQHSDIICDFLYHIKYRHIGHAHGKKEEIEQLVTSLHLPLKTRLRFLTHSLAENAD
jgi:mediator of RNA polymerase II transcription subunit 23